MRLLDKAGRLFEMSAGRIKRGLVSFHRDQAVLAFTLQLVPTVRLFTPSFAALLHGNSRSILTASPAGIAVWNSIFIGMGFYTSYSIESANTLVLALGCLLVAEAALFWIARRVSADRKVRAMPCKI